MNWSCVINKVGRTEACRPGSNKFLNTQTGLHLHIGWTVSCDVVAESKVGKPVRFLVAFRKRFRATARCNSNYLYWCKCRCCELWANGKRSACDRAETGGFPRASKKWVESAGRSGRAACRAAL